MGGRSKLKVMLRHLPTINICIFIKQNKRFSLTPKTLHVYVVQLICTLITFFKPVSFHINNRVSLSDTAFVLVFFFFQIQVNFSEVSLSTRTDLTQL